MLKPKTRLKSDKCCQNAKLDPGSRQTDIAVADTPGLSLRLTCDWVDKRGKPRPGSKTWTARYRRHSDGRQRRATIGPYPAVSLADARQRFRDLQNDVSTGIDPVAVKQARRGAGTFKDVADNWMRRIGKDKATASQNDDRHLLDMNILPVIGDLKIKEIDRRDAERVVDAVIDRGALVRANRTLTLMRTIFRWAIKRGECIGDPTASIDKNKEEPRDRVLTDGELRTLWDKLDTAPMSDGTRVMIRLAAVTAQRIGEVATIAKTDLALDGLTPVWTIPAARAKNGKEHRVPLSPLAISLMERALSLAGDGLWVFPNPSNEGPVDPHAATRAVSRMRKSNKLGVKDFRIHDLRRTAATGMGDLGQDDFTIGLVLNHSGKGVTRRVYNKSNYDAPKRLALEAWARHVEVIIGLRAPTDVGNVVPIRKGA